MLDPAIYKRIRYRPLRMHLQFVSGNNLRNAYDYFMLVCGPLERGAAGARRRRAHSDRRGRRAPGRGFRMTPAIAKAIYVLLAVGWYAHPLSVCAARADDAGRSQRPRRARNRAAADLADRAGHPAR